MTEHPEALRLAQELDAYHTMACHKQAAAELRRLHALNGELLEALKAITTAPDLRTYGLAMQNACIAIARAEGEKT